MFKRLTGSFTSRVGQFFGVHKEQTNVKENESTETQPNPDSKDGIEDDGAFEDAMETQDGKDDSSGARHVTNITTQYASFNGQMIITKEKNDCRENSSAESCSESEDEDSKSIEENYNQDEFSLPKNGSEPCAAKELNECLDEINDWIKDPDLHKNCHEYLQKLWERVQGRYIIEGCYDFWVKILNKNRDLAKFFGNLKDMENSHRECNFSAIRFHIRRLTHPAGVKGFIGSNNLKPWLEDTSLTEDWRPHGVVNNLTSFVSVIKGEVLPYLSRQANVHDLEQESKRESFEFFITNQIAEATKSMFNGLQKLESKEEFVYAKVIVMQLHYNLESRIFEIPITKLKLEEFITSVEEKCRTFSSLTGVNRQQYIVKEAICNLGKFASTGQREKNFNILLQPMMLEFDRRIASVFSSFTTQGAIDFEGLSQELQRLLYKEDKRMLDIDLTKLAKTLNSSKDQDTIDPIFDISNEFKDDKYEILRTFGLEPYFPSKIEVQHVMKIERQFSIEKVNDIPWIILKKLIMLDHRGRDEVLSTFRNKCADGSPSFTGDLDELIGDVCTNTVSEFNPLDVFITIFCCCSNLLKQILVEKMFLCQLAIPFLFKPLLSDNYQLSLWPMRALQSDGEYRPLASSITRVVSFIRLKRPLYSKSELLSNVLSNGGYENTFHHRNCFLGGTPKQLTDGAVEASWYLSSKTDMINKNVTCLNLRGDALEHKTQLSFLKEVSDTVFILMNITDLCDPTCRGEILQMYTSKSMVVLLLNHKSEDDDFQSLLKPFRNEIEQKNYKERTKVVMLSFSGKPVAEATLKQHIKSQIKTCVERFPGKCLTELVSVAKSLNISVDENEKDIAFGKKLAAEIVSSMEPDLDNDKIKELHFPLQGSMWSRLSSNIKELSKVKDKKSAEHRERLSEELNEIRMDQLLKCQNLSPVIHRFIEVLIAYQDQGDILSYFMKWLSILLKERTLDNTAAEKSPNAQMTLLGIEQFIREIGQIYEAVHSSTEYLPGGIVHKFDVLPTLVAKLILHGQTVEVMDGDNSNIALTWIKAVFSSIAQLTNNARLLKVSVAGVQSAGKSTLVNAVYGLTFSVSSGRCTKGVFMEMVPVETNESNHAFDYVIVLDCEGLRSQETAASTYDNDNRLATFIIGMSDICLINIKGENYAEMGDVLQVVVHAFYRLKSRNSDLKLHQSCLFIHQNVSSEDADEQNRNSKTNFIEHLDEITQFAAQQDGYTETTEFSKMIDFDHKKHCWYFKDFWHGNPPMAAVNDAYSENVSDVRQYMHSELLKNRRYLTITDLTEHMEDLWNGILTDDFIFSFRSSIEIKAYSDLESKFNEIQWDLEQKLFQRIQKEANDKIRWHSTVQENRDNVEETRSGLHRNIKELTRNSKSQLEDFIESSDEYREIYLTWKTSKMLTLSKVADHFLEKADLQLEEKQKQMKLDMKRSEMKNKLNEQVKSSAKSFHESCSENPSEKELDLGFEENWISILQQWAHGQLSHSPPIKEKIKQKLFSHFKGKQAMLEKELKKYWDKSDTLKVLEGSITVDDIEKEHIHIKTQAIPRRKLKPRQQCNLETVDVTEKILRRADAYLDDLDYIDSKYDDSQIYLILHFVDEEIQKHNEKYAEQRKFTILNPYKVKLYVHICKYAVHKFQSMNDKYEEKHNTMAWCKSQKKTAERLFKNIVQQESEEQFAASAFCDIIEDALFRTVRGNLRHLIEQYVCKEFENKKSNLMKEIMLHLLKKSNMQETEKYLEDPYLYSQNWITLYMKSSLKEGKENQNSVFSQMVLQLVAENVSAVEKSVHWATRGLDRQQFGSTYRWVQHFKNGIKEHIQFTDEALKEVTQRNIHNFQSFQTKILHNLDELRKRVQRVISQAYESCIYQDTTNLYEIVTDKLWGCPEFCPFCGEPCKHSDPNHVDQGIDHSCIQHRPLAFNGIFEYNTKERKNILLTDSCYGLVRSPKKFSCSWCAYDCQKSNNHSQSGTEEEHGFKEFKTFFPNWEIQASSKVELYQYWCYVMTSYAFMLKKKYGCDVIIPSSWKKISENKAKDSLLRSLKLK